MSESGDSLFLSFIFELIVYFFIFLFCFLFLIFSPLNQFLERFNKMTGPISPLHSWSWSYGISVAKVHCNSLLNSVGVHYLISLIDQETLLCLKKLWFETWHENITKIRNLECSFCTSRCTLSPMHFYGILLFFFISFLGIVIRKHERLNENGCK